MSTILAGNFPSIDAAGRAILALNGAGIAPDRICSFRVNPPGQHATYPLGGDEYASEGAEEGGGGALKGAAIGGAIGLTAGLAALPLAGPAAVAGGAGIGAYVGSLAGALNNMGEEVEPNSHGKDDQRSAGILLAVLAPEDESLRSSAADILRRNGAREVEETEGTWSGGVWVDFDPTHRGAPPDEGTPAS